mmetsp:Transcript_23415/g.46783  ORF Transcript_23415/g.46783 Transcript_23415/m.46783 type:complete len:104 (-) Transcript_23415:475-786(-)
MRRLSTTTSSRGLRCSRRMEALLAPTLAPPSPRPRRAPPSPRLWSALTLSLTLTLTLTLMRLGCAQGEAQMKATRRRGKGVAGQLEWLQVVATADSAARFAAK